MQLYINRLVCKKKIALFLQHIIYLSYTPVYINDKVNLFSDSSYCNLTTRDRQMRDTYARKQEKKSLRFRVYTDIIEKISYFNYIQQCIDLNPTFKDRHHMLKNKICERRGVYNREIFHKFHLQ